MFLTRHFVFIHVPKTGGNFVQNILTDHAPASWELEICEEHATYEQIPDSHIHLPRLAFARNPFSWHVSWFHFQQKVRHRFYRRISEDGKLGFADSMRRAYTGDGPLAHSSGALTQTLFDMLGTGLQGAKVGKVEAMRAELLRMFGECTEVPTSMAEAILDEPPANTSKHAHYSTYYDEEVRNIIQAKEAAVFDFFHYEWNEQPPN